MCSFKGSLDIGKQRTNEFEKKSKKIPFQETQTKRIFSWAKKNNLRGRKMQAEMKTNKKSK